MLMHDPAHPGEVLRLSCLKPLELTVQAAAAGLGVTRKTLSDLLNGHSNLSADMSIRLEKAGWGTADHWLRMQTAWTLWKTRQHADRIKIKGFTHTQSQSHEAWH